MFLRPCAFQCKFYLPVCLGQWCESIQSLSVSQRRICSSFLCVIFLISNAIHHGYRASYTPGPFPGFSECTPTGISPHTLTFLREEYNNSPTLRSVPGLQHPVHQPWLLSRPDRGSHLQALRVGDQCLILVTRQFFLKPIHCLTLTTGTKQNIREKDFKAIKELMHVSKFTSPLEA